jgi:hypothetical protein
VNESGFFQTNIDEGGLHAGEHAGDFSLIDIAGDAALLGALDVNLRKGVIFE